MITLEELKKKHHYNFPKLFKTLWEADRLNWMRGFETPLPEGKTWAEDVYPALKENPPLLLHSGGSDFELLTPAEILHFEFPDEWDREEHHFIPFAKTAEGNIYAFYENMHLDGENPVVLIWEDDETEIIAKNFEDFIFRKMLEASDDIDKDDLSADYGDDNAMERYREDLQRDLETVRPYLKKEYISVLEAAYQGEVLETLISYGFTLDTPVKVIIKKMLDFEQMGEVFEHER